MFNEKIFFQKKRGFGSVVSYAVKKGRKELLPSILNQNNSSCAFLNANLTTNDTTGIERIQSDAGLTPETITKSNVSLGAGILRYNGNEWLNGAVFLGKNDSGRYILKFMGQEGLKILQDLSKYPETVQLLNGMTVTQCSYYLTVSADSSINTAEKWREACAKTILNCVTSKLFVFLDKDSLQIGKKGANKVINFKPLNPSAKDFSFQKTLIKVSFTSTPASRLIGSLLTPSSSENNMAFMVFETLKTLGETDDFLESMRTALTNDFRLGSVVVPVITPKAKQSEIPKEMKHFSSACTAIVNKATMKSYSEIAFDILEDKLFKVLKERKGEILNYDMKMKKLAQFILSETSSSTGGTSTEGTSTGGTDNQKSPSSGKKS